MDFDYCGYLYRDNQASCVNTAKLQKRLVSLEQILLGLRQVLGTGRNPLLLRKSCEILPCPPGVPAALPPDGNLPAAPRQGIKLDLNPMAG